ncbi:MAG TPA: glycosyl hydrolase [Candidatus Hydrogenedentes bacterium]|nr:glycosyl hydrolase [Candidatus Hydrogenedentota bacterium]HQM48885.1 glycosyl hydrolase [Candidatus Hydrogenedentota bacterium]
MIKRGHFAEIALQGVVIVGMWAIFPVFQAGAQPALDELERVFTEVPMEARRWTGPLFWLHGDESRERLEMYLGKVAEGGNGCFTAESRPHNDWLGEGWFRDLGICLEAAKRHNLDMWIFDEKWWPSGEAGGRVPAEYASKRLQAAVFENAGAIPPSVENLVAVIAGRAKGEGWDGNSLLDLTRDFSDGILDTTLPKGFQIAAFTWALGPKRGENYLVDGASQAAVDWYLDTVYQPHYDRFPNDFGPTIKGFFYDEPETYGDWGTEVIPMLNELGVDWKRAFIAKKLTLADPDEQTAALFKYNFALAEAWGRTLYGGITNWCHEHHVRSIGHFLEHADCPLSQDLCAGDMFQLEKYSDMGGIDAVFDQFIMGKRVARDHPTWQTPKLGSSITHAYGKPGDVTMVEIFGARGQDLTYPEMKWWADHMHVSGVNFFIPHSFNPRAPDDTDCPPYFYNGGFEPRWPLYRVFADYTARLSHVLTGGRHVCPVALLYLGQSCHAGKAVRPDTMSEALQDALYDCDWIPYEVFEKDMRISGPLLNLRDEKYHILIVPPVETIPYETLLKARDFFESGGVVAGYGFLPSKSASLGRGSGEIADLVQALWGGAEPSINPCRTAPSGGKSFLLPESVTPEMLQTVFRDEAGIHATLEVVEGDTGNWLHVLHRVKDERDVFFVANQVYEGPARTFTLRAQAKGFPECWDPLRNDISALPFTRISENEAEFKLTLEPLESVLLVFTPESRSKPARIQESGAKPRRVLDLARTGEAKTPEPAALSLEGCKWVWHPGENALTNAPPGMRYFRKTVSLPDTSGLASARALLSADNAFVLFVNGNEIGRSAPGDEAWRQPQEFQLTGALRAGDNVLAIAAENTSGKDNPAGVIGRFEFHFTSDNVVFQINLDASWQASREAPDGWNASVETPGTWLAAAEVVQYGDAPWGHVGKPLSRPANPFEGVFALPEGVDLAKERVCVEMDGVFEGARLTVNGAYAGGVIGAPFRVDITRHLASGENKLLIEPYAPETVRLALYD